MFLKAGIRIFFGVPDLHPSFVERTKVERWLHKIFLSLALVLCLLRFAYLRADFPNHSPWMMDQSKFTDEGWWANAAVRHFLIGHWQVAGDYNPAAAVPVWRRRARCGWGRLPVRRRRVV